MENTLVVAMGEGIRELNWEFEINRCKLVYIEQINSKVLLFNTGNYMQYLVINHNGKEYEKQCVCVFVYN